MEPQIITIVIHSDIDPSSLLEIANEAAKGIAEEASCQTGEQVIFLEEETTVEYSNNGGKGIVGGQQYETR